MFYSRSVGLMVFWVLFRILFPFGNIIALKLQKSIVYLTQQSNAHVSGWKESPTPFPAAANQLTSYRFAVGCGHRAPRPADCTGSSPPAQCAVISADDVCGTWARTAGRT
ncbi:MAG: hypothetical protein AAB262_07500 [Elusimicrobiota bacterium]